MFYKDGTDAANFLGQGVMWLDISTTPDTIRLASTTNPLPIQIISGSSAGTEYTEDAAAAANPAGPAVILIRKDTPASTVTTDGDNVAQRGTDYGAAYVQIVSSTGSFIDSFGGGTQYTEDAAAAANPVGNALIGVRADSLAGLTTTDGDNVAARMTDKGELYVKQTDAVPVTDNSGSLTVDYATTGSGTATGALRVELPTNGTGVIATVTAVTAITNALPAGTNAIGKLAANSGVDIGDVDITSIVPGTGATNLGKAEDDAHSSGDVGIQILAVRKATPANVSGTDGDYEPLQISSGRLWTSSTIDAALPAGTNAIGKLAANSGVDIGDVDILSIAAGDNNIGNVDIVTVPTDPFGANADAASATGSISAKLRFIASTGIPVTGTVAVTQSGTWDEVGINDSGNSITVDGTVTASVPTVASATLSNVASSATSVTLIASNASRKGGMIFNDSTQLLYVKFGATASSTSYTTQILAGGYYELPIPIYTGVVDGIWASANGNARVTEL